MKIYLVLTLILSFIMALSPLLSLAARQASLFDSKPQVQTTEKEIEVIAETTEEQNEPEPTISVMRVGSGNIESVEMTDYVIGTVASEIPPTYEKEAIKAQAVACYTYALWMKNNPDISLVQGAEITDSSSHQNYKSKEELKEKWGEKFNEYYEKFSSCVSTVSGEYLEFEGEPILACYHAISPGKTENALTVWGEDIAYLKSVPANGDILSPNFDSTVVFSEKEFKEKAKSLENLSLKGGSDKWLSEAKTSEAGFVKSIKIGSRAFGGNEVRKAFSLKSPYFTLKKENDSFVFHVKGRGHGLGMSQYSADYMARQGSSYEEILFHFYSGATLVKG